MSEEGYNTLTDAEVEERVERALLKACGDLLPPGAKVGSTAPIFGKDSIAQIEHDFPSLFGAEKKAEP